MHGVSSIDAGRTIDWGRTSLDYSTWRPDYPPEFYGRLSMLGIGRPGQEILDLGTGVGFLARQFARRGARVIGVDVAAGQIEEARRVTAAEGLDVDFRVARAEETGLPDTSFDVLSASQSWLYFDRPRMIAEAKRLLRPGGVLATAHFCWLPRLDAIARASEQLVLQYNPDWSAADWEGRIPPIPAWAADEFELVAMFQFDAAIPFTRERWRGRVRACRGVGAALPSDDVARFDREHEKLLETIAGETFTVLHRIDCHVLRPV